MRRIWLVILLFCPVSLYASFIESSIGTAVVNDATATYYNPAALTLLKNPQIIPLASVAYFHSAFSGQVTQTASGLTQTGTANSRTYYYLPTFYFATPLSDKVFAGFAIVSNLFNRDIEQNSILRYAQSSNQVQDIDFVPAIGIQLNQYFSIGAGLNFSYAKFILRPIAGAPSLNIPDSQSRNESSATSMGGDVGWLLKLSKSILIGFNYRSSVTYQLSGTSIFEGIPEITSHHYHFQFWTPARSVLSTNYMVNKKLGFIATVQFIQWGILKDLHIHNIASPIGILSNATAPFHLHNSWIVTFGNHYHINPKWVLRVAGSYVESPSTGDYQIANGDSIVLGISSGYTISKSVIIDGSYAHVFMKDQHIHIITGRNIINGVNQGSRDGVSLKLTFNL